MLHPSWKHRGEHTRRNISSGLSWTGVKGKLWATCSSGKRTVMLVALGPLLKRSSPNVRDAAPSLKYRSSLGVCATRRNRNPQV